MTSTDTTGPAAPSHGPPGFFSLKQYPDAAGKGSPRMRLLLRGRCGRRRSLRSSGEGGQSAGHQKSVEDQQFESELIPPQPLRSAGGEQTAKDRYGEAQ